MQALLLATVIDGAATEACDYDVAVDGGAFQPPSPSTPGPAEFQVSDSASFVDIKAKPHSPDFWPVQGRFKFQVPGSLVPIDTPDNFGPPRSSGTPGDFLIVVDTYLSRLRDASAACQASLAAVPPHRLTATRDLAPDRLGDSRGLRDRLFRPRSRRRRQAAGDGADHRPGGRGRRLRTEGNQGAAPDRCQPAQQRGSVFERVVSHVLDWEQLPDALPGKHLKPVFVRDASPPSTAG